MAQEKSDSLLAEREYCHEQVPNVLKPSNLAFQSSYELSNSGSTAVKSSLQVAVRPSKLLDV